MTIQQVKQRFGIIGNCREINAAVEIAMQVAPTDVNVLVNGENGTGKDVFSRIIHQFSKPKHQSFIAINMGAIPEGTLDSELFGHEKGAFTSAYDSRKGYFEEVEGGTIFLDEIAEMPMATQSRLLRLLENGEYLRVGSSKVQRANVRVIAATNKNLVELIRQGKFREDLFFRLNTVSIVVPALRDRREDIEMLFNYFSMEFSDKYRREPIELDDEAIPLLYKYRWPGNIRELRNLAEKLSVLVKGNTVSEETLRQNLLIQERYLPSIVRSPGLSSSIEEDISANSKELEQLYKMITALGKEVSELKKAIYIGIQGRDSVPNTTKNEGIPPLRRPVYRDDFDGEFRESDVFSPNIREVRDVTPLLEESLSLEHKEKEMIIKALHKHGNNRKRAAEELGISERTLYRKIKNFDIDL